MFRFFLLSALMFFIGYGIFSFFSRLLGRGTGQSRRSTHQQQANRNNPPQEEKQFSKDIGEYVSYEEIKDEEKK